MVRLQTLDLRIGVRVPASQPLIPKSLSHDLSGCTYWNETLLKTPEPPYRCPNSRSLQHHQSHRAFSKSRFLSGIITSARWRSRHRCIQISRPSPRDPIEV